MFSVQRYPEVKLVAGKDIVRPYDVAAWTLPLMMGVEVERAPLPDGLKRLRAATAPRLPTDGDASRSSPGSPENAKLVNAALRGKGASRSRAPRSQAGGKSWPAGTVFLDAGGREAPRRQGPRPACPGRPCPRPPPRREADGAARRPLQALGGLHGRGLDPLHPRAVRLRAEDPRQQDDPRGQALAAASTSIVLPDVTKEVIATGKPQAARRAR